MRSFAKDIKSGLLLPSGARRGGFMLPSKQRGFLSMMPAVATPYRDPRYASVSSLLWMDGANGSTTFTDQKGNSWTRTGTPTIVTSNSIFGGSSLNLPGSGSFISASGSIFNLNSSDYCIEAFAYVTATPGAQGACIYTNYNGTQSTGRCFLNVGATYTVNLGEQDANGTNNFSALSAANVVSPNNWFYIAGLKIGTAASIYVGPPGGVATLVASGTSAVRTSFTNSARIGAFDPAGGTFASTFTGQIGMLRVTKFGRTIGNSPTARFPNAGP